MYLQNLLENINTFFNKAKSDVTSLFVNILNNSISTTIYGVHREIYFPLKFPNGFFAMKFYPVLLQIFPSKQQFCPEITHTQLHNFPQKLYYGLKSQPPTKYAAFQHRMLLIVGVFIRKATIASISRSGLHFNATPATLEQLTKKTRWIVEPFMATTLH